jgi:sugar lactone lactonase YvrE
LFVNFPRWSSSIPLSVAQLGSASELLPFPDKAWNEWKPGADPKRAFVCVQSVVAGPDGNLWVLDPANPEFQGVVEGGAKLVVFNPKTRAVVRRFDFSAPIVQRDSYLNDIRILKDQSYAFITDSGVGGIVVLDLKTKRSRRVLDGSPAVRSTGAPLKFPFGEWLRNGKRPEIHSDGIALSGDQQSLYFQALTGDVLYRVPVKALTDGKLTAVDVAARVERVATSAPVDGIETGPDGTLYLTGLESYSLRRLKADGQLEEWLRDGRLVWPDSIAFSNEGTLYVTTSQIQHGQEPPGPYRIFAVETRE